MASTNRLFAIGDVHGHSKPLKALIDELDFRPNDTVVMLGDYIDRGPDSCGVIEALIALSKTTKLVCLRGNHEIMLQQAANDRTAIPYWLNFGGEETMDSYGAKSFDQIPEWHWDFFGNLRPYFETENETFVHAGLDPTKSLSAQDDDSLYWNFFETPKPHISGKRMICGHTPQRDGRPTHLGFATCIDTDITGCGWLTCLDLSTDGYLQSDENGNLREGQLELLRPS